MFKSFKYQIFSSWSYNNVVGRFHSDLFFSDTVCLHRFNILFRQDRRTFRRENLIDYKKKKNAYTYDGPLLI